ncbi:MAG: hypothetical protein RLZZ127_793, partial [Planctomycetota bacterium]
MIRLLVPALAAMLAAGDADPLLAPRAVDLHPDGAWITASVDGAVDLDPAWTAVAVEGAAWTITEVVRSEP